jgi:gliding motility-associated-like protein
MGQQAEEFANALHRTLLPDGRAVLETLHRENMIKKVRTADVTVTPNHGTVVINLDGTITYTPDQGFTGIDSFTYQICDDGIPSLCDTAVVYVTVIPERPNIFIPNGFSPDGDAFNQQWEIIDITQYPKNEVIIFNRWGNKVFEAKPYQNEWKGVNQKGEDLPDGTYYYVLKLNDDGNTTYTGFVVVNRSKQ